MFLGAAGLAIAATLALDVGRLVVVGVGNAEWSNVGSDCFPVAAEGPQVGARGSDCLQAVVKSKHQEAKASST